LTARNPLLTARDSTRLFADKAAETRQKDEAAKAEAEGKNAPGAPTGTNGPNG